MTTLKLLIGFMFLLGLEKNPAGALDTYLKENLSQYKRFEYKIVSLPGGLQKYDPEKLEIDPSRSFKEEKGYAYVPVSIHKQNKTSTKTFLTLRLKLYQDVLVTARKLDRYEDLDNNDFVIEEREISGLSFAVFPESLYTEGTYRLIANLRADEILLKDHIEKKPVIKIGSRVEALLIKNNLTISFPASARGDGQPGEIIRIAGLDKRIFYAEVISPSQVKIVE